MMTLFTALLMLMLMPFSNAMFKSAQICHFKQGQYICKHATRHILQKTNIPSKACMIHDCTHCVKANQSFVLTDNHELVEPTKFILDVNPSSSMNTSVDNDPRIIHVSKESTIINPRLINFEVCFHEERTRQLETHASRRLLEDETAVFQGHNLTIKFIDPILHLPALGRVIIRTDDFEHLMSVPRDLILVIPFELLAYPNTITIIYIHPTGLTVTGILHVAGKSICQLRSCFFCQEVFRTITCLPKLYQVVFYTLSTLTFVIFLWSIKFALKTIVWCLKSTIYTAIMIYKIFKIITRACLLLGTYLGDLITGTLRKSYTFLESQAAGRENASINSIVVLTIIVLLPLALADCNTHTVIKSDLRTCEKFDDNTKQCTVHTTAEITLPTLNAESCLWFTDQKDDHLFSLKLKLQAVKCHFHTERQYFTFPVKPNHISQISCIFNEYCGRGVHCIQRNVGYEGLRFEAETIQSRQYPGVSTCVGGGAGNGCFIVTRSSCNFQRTFYIPDLLRSYEISKITGHSCHYHVSITHTENNTISTVVIHDQTYTKQGIKISVLGSYDQSQLHLTDHLIQRVGQPKEAYLAPACHRNHPKAGEIGAVQANTSFTTSFTFDPEISTCDFYEDKLRCFYAPDALDLLSSSQEHALPLERNLHLFQMEKGQLTSSMLVTAAVRLQLYFSDYKIVIRSSTICPKFDSLDVETSGCYDCPILARLSFSASSTCQPGTVAVEFQELKVFTKALYLSSDPSKLIIKFLGEKQCYNEKLCLRATTVVQCQVMNFCLDEPSIELKQLNLNYTTQISTPSSSHWSSWFQMPDINTSYIFMKLISSSVFILCLSITLFSTCITCCCRGR